jgi:hypothetical protein
MSAHAVATRCRPWFRTRKGHDLTRAIEPGKEPALCRLRASPKFDLPVVVPKAKPTNVLFS